MKNWYPSRQVLGSPAWLWVVLAVLLFLLANPQILMDPALNLQPIKLAEPPDRGAIASERITVARNGDSFRFVPVAERDASREAIRENKRTEPFWGVFVELWHQQESFSCGASYLLPGLIRGESRWTCVLRANRADYGWYMELREHGFDWKADKENPYELPPEQIRKLRPLVVAELNRRHPTTKLGDRLERMLDDGLEASSTSFAPQNALILFRWLALLMAFVGLCSMFIRPHKVPVYIPEVGYLPTLLAYVRRRRREANEGVLAPVETPARGV
jgi:hypothetical protein